MSHNLIIIRRKISIITKNTENIKKKLMDLLVSLLLNPRPVKNSDEQIWNFPNYQEITKTMCWGP